MNKQLQPEVSVCVVTYNQIKYLEDCLNSIVTQVVSFSFEVIISDDCSTDGTQKIIQNFHERYPELIIPVLRSSNIGPFENYVQTHTMARGNYVVHIDGDDRMLPNKLQLQYNYLYQYPKCTVVWHKMNLFDDIGNFFDGHKYDIGEFENRSIEIDDILSIGSIAAHSSIMYRRSARKTRQLNFPMLDLFYSLEFLSTGYGKYLPEVLGEYRVSAGGAFSTNAKRANYMRKLCAQHWMYYLKIFPEKRKKIFLFSVLNFLMDLKNKRRTAFDFLKVALSSISYVSLKEIIWTYKNMRKFVVPKIFLMKKNRL